MRILIVALTFFITNSVFCQNNKAEDVVQANLDAYNNRDIDSFMLYIAEKQKWNLLIMIFLVFGIFVSFIIAENHLGVVKGISTTLVFYYLSHLYLSAKLSKAFRIKQLS